MRNYKERRAILAFYLRVRCFNFRIIFMVWQNSLLNILFATKKFIKANLYLNLSNLIKTVGKSDEIILVIQDEISTSIRNAIDEVSDKKDVKIYQYQLFTAELPIVLGVPQHRILRGSEREAILSDIKVRPSELPSVLDTDPQIVWIGGKAGDIVQILRTDGRGISEFYRYVIRGVQIKK